MRLALIPLLLAAAAGVIMAFQGTLNTALGKVVGLLEATFLVYLSGTLALAVMLFLLRWGKGSLTNCTRAPWYCYLGGLLGVLIIYLVVASISRLGVSLATTAIVVGQVTTALMIDHFGLFGLKEVPLTWWKFMGVLFLAAGARLMLN